MRLSLALHHFLCLSYLRWGRKQEIRYAANGHQSAGKSYTAPAYVRLWNQRANEITRLWFFCVAVNLICRLCFYCVQKFILLKSKELSVPLRNNKLLLPTDFAQSVTLTTQLKDLWQQRCVCLCVWGGKIKKLTGSSFNFQNKEKVQNSSLF